MTNPSTEKKCLITSCKGKNDCLDHCPCDCHTPAKEGWEQVWADFTNHIRSNAEVKEFLRSILASDRADLLREIEKELEDKLVNVSLAPHLGPSFNTGVQVSLEIIRSHMKE